MPVRGNHASHFLVVPPLAAGIRHLVFGSLKEIAEEPLMSRFRQHQRLVMTRLDPPPLLSLLLQSQNLPSLKQQLLESAQIAEQRLLELEARLSQARRASVNQENELRRAHFEGTAVRNEEVELGLMPKQASEASEDRRLRLEKELSQIGSMPVGAASDAGNGVGAMLSLHRFLQHMPASPKTSDRATLATSLIASRRRRCVSRSVQTSLIRPQGHSAGTQTGPVKILRLAEWRNASQETAKQSQEHSLTLAALEKQIREQQAR